MRPRFPVIATLIVAAAAAIMVALGIWQLGRAREKEALLARYAASQDLPTIAFPDAGTKSGGQALFRRATATCAQPGERRSTAGRNRAGEVGYVHIVDCKPNGSAGPVTVEIGWSRDPRAAFSWRGGSVTGVIAPDSRSGMRLVADSPASGLQPSVAPSIETIPNNHRSYAVQWFLFAALAVLIYVLAVRKKLKEAAALPAEPRKPDE